MERSASWDDAIEHLKEFEFDIDDDFNCGLKGFLNLDEELKNNVFGFVKVGLCAERIRNFKLWERAGIYNDFADYCKRGLNKSCWHINRLIDAAKVVMGLIANGFKILPQCEAQCRPLIKYAGDPDNDGTIADIWGDVIQKIQPDKITASSIESITNGDKEEQPKGLSKETINLIKQQAKLEGKSPDDLIRELLRDRAEMMAIDPQSIDSGSIDPESIDPESIDPVSGMSHKETAKLIDRVERQWLNPVKQKIENAYDRIFESIGDINWGKNAPELKYE